MSETIVDDLLAAVERAMGEGTPNLSSGPHACQLELERCARGLAYLDHLYGRVLDDMDACRAEWDEVEAQAAIASRGDAKALTATEVKARITQWVNKRPEARELRERLAAAERRKAKIERWMRSLEKRISAAQSALNGHEQLARYGGGA